MLMTILLHTNNTEDHNEDYDMMVVVDMKLSQHNEWMMMMKKVIKLTYQHTNPLPTLYDGKEGHEVDIPTILKTTMRIMMGIVMNMSTPAPECVRQYL